MRSPNAADTGYERSWLIRAAQERVPVGEGRLLGLPLLTSFGAFPLSVALAAVTVNAFGPAPFFVFTAVALAAAILGGLTQRSWRDFGATAQADIQPKVH